MYHNFAYNLALIHMEHLEHQPSSAQPGHLSSESVQFTGGCVVTVVGAVVVAGETVLGSDVTGGGRLPAQLSFNC